MSEGVGAEETGAAGAGEREGVVDTGIGDVVERSVSDEDCCGTCRVDGAAAGSGAAAGVSRTGEGDLEGGRAGSCSSEMRGDSRADSFLSTGVVALLDTIDGTEDRSECSDRVDSEESTFSRLCLGSASCWFVCEDSTAGGLCSAN